ncbi:50S ribosomal protein L11 methyltransferase, partial [Thermodesulfobacteriota bacterium]
LAFGTGHHASTQLALILLEELFYDNKSKLSNVLDVGTGSGILAMGCGLFGAHRVLAIDNDPDAVETANNNIIRNGLAHSITVSSQDIASVTPGHNLIVANITHDTLAAMAETLTGLLAPEGCLVLSGILAGGQEKSICDIYTGHGLHFIKILTKDEWAALLFQKEKLQ